MANPIIQQQNQTSSTAIMKQALGAMLRGESPQQFLKNLAKTNPQLQGLDLDNIDKTAEELCNKSGEDYNTAKANIRNNLSQLI